MAKEVKTETAETTEEQVIISLDINGIPVYRNADGSLIHGITRPAFMADAKSKEDGRKAFCNYRAACCDERIAELTEKIAGIVVVRDSYLIEATQSKSEMTDEEKKAAKLAKLEKQIAALKKSMGEVKE